MLTLDNPNLASELRALTSARKPVDASLLLSFLAACQFKNGSHPRTGVWCESLMALALLRHAEADRIIRETFGLKPSYLEPGLKNHELERVRRQNAAGRALCISRGLHDPLAVIHRACVKRGKGSVSQNLKDALIALDPYGDIEEHGFHEHLLYREQEDLLRTPDALDVIGARRFAAIFRKVLGVFEPPGFPADFHERQARLDSLGDEGDDVLSQANDDWDYCPEPLEAFVHLHLARHREAILALEAEGRTKT